MGTLVRWLLTIELHSGKVLNVSHISGVPDVIFYNPTRRCLYITVGDPGVVDVFDTRRMTLTVAVVTEPDAHTLAFDATQQKIYDFLPETHRAAVYQDRG